jgi:hypothetical protein
MALLPGYKANFDTLRRAFLAGDAALMECQMAATGEAVVVVCAANRQDDGSVEFAPFAMLFPDNPYELLNPPKPEGGFFTQDEIWQDQ